MKASYSNYVPSRRVDRLLKVAVVIGGFLLVAGYTVLGLVAL